MTRARPHSRIVVAAALAIMAAVLAPSAAGAGTTPRAENGGLEKIEHIVMIMQENRTFDHYFGMFPGADGFPIDENGDVDICIPNPYEPGTCVRPTHAPGDRQVGGPHSYRSYVTSVNGGKMDGYEEAFADATKPCPKTTKPRESSWCERTTDDPTNVMGYKLEEDIPNYWRYAREFVLQDHMFAASNSWSVPAHLYKVSGWSALCKNRNPMSVSYTHLTLPTNSRV